MPAVIHQLPSPRQRASLEDVRREIAGGWDVEACVIEDGLSVPDRIRQAAEQRTSATVLEFRRPDEKGTP